MSTSYGVGVEEFPSSLDGQGFEAALFDDSPQDAE
jgi:hypothetical protein